MAQIDYFLKIPGVDGESTDDKHKGELELLSFNWGEVQTGTAGHGAGAGAGKVQPHDFNFVKKTDKSSPRLFIACATGEHFKSAQLTCRKAGTGQQEYMKISMDEVMVSAFETAGSQTDILPTDSVSLNFAKLEISYKEQKPDGSLGGEVKQRYDFAANKKV